MDPLAAACLTVADRRGYSIFGDLHAAGSGGVDVTVLDAAGDLVDLHATMARAARPAASGADGADVLEVAHPCGLVRVEVRPHTR